MHGFINNLPEQVDVTPERWEQVSRIFKSAIDLDVDARDAYLARECGQDELLRKEVSRLIESHQRASDDNFIGTPAFVSSDPGGKTFANGQQVGSYEIIRHLGSGGMGEVYLANDKRLDRQVALKILSGELAHDKRRLQRFQQEARMASSLNQPNILTIFEFDEVDSFNFLATEYIDGETLRDQLRGKPLRLGEVLDISIQVVAALDAAHEAKIVHRDIKPENIMIRRRDQIVKVLDFGLAKASEVSSVTHATDSEIATQYKTAAGTILGTVNYMSPEQAQGLRLDARTDLWSVGVMIYEMVAGEAPFTGRTTSHTIVQILENDPAPLSKAAKVRIPDELERIVNKSLTKSVDERYQTAKDLLVDLRKLKKQVDLDVEIKRSLAPLRSDVTAATPTAAVVPLPGPKSSINRNRILLLIGGVVVVLIAALWAINSLRPKNQNNPASVSTSPASPQRTLTYSITVQKYRYNKPFETPFQLGKEMIFELDYQIRLNINSAQAGFLYVLNEGPSDKGQPGEFVVLFPSSTSNSGSALVSENHPVQIPDKSWIHFDNEKGTERLWLVFAENAVRELEPIRTFASPKTAGLITDTAVRDEVQAFLRSHSNDKPLVEQDLDRKQTIVSSRRDLLVHAIDLEHQ
ncbi:MAG TPA: serine/threonine-protein kinase [Pyrinomonadaceae bacterium]|nr:serine/threonine-protein kinase [Pyrinomonadaceae bacterium]